MQKKQLDWKDKKEKGSTILMRLMVFLSLFLGRKISRIFLYAIVLFYVIFSGEEVASSREYLAKVLNRKPRWRDVYRHFLSFASVLHDRIYWLSNRSHLFVYSVNGANVLKEALSKQRGVLLMGAHLGSFEALRSIADQMPSLQVSMLMHPENALKINNILQHIAPSVNEQIIPLGTPHTMLSVQEKLSTNGLVGMLVDRSITQNDDQKVNFLGSLAPFPLSPFRLATALQVPVVFMTGLYLGNNRYEVYFESVFDFSTTQRANRQKDIQIAMHNYQSILEKYCRYAPYNWFNFYHFWTKND